MKLLLFIAFFVFSFSVLSQRGNNNVWKLNPEILKKYKGNDSLQKQMQNYSKRKNLSNYLLSNMPSNVAVLPQDHMPCLVPDTKSIAPIPNAWSGVVIPYKAQHNSIPNPSLVPRVLKFQYNMFDNSLGTK